METIIQNCQLGSIYRACQLLFVIAVTILIAHSHSSTADDAVSLQPNNQEIVMRGRELYAQHCASCHGKNLEGEPNWKDQKQNGRMPAPPHDMSGHTWHHPDQVLFEITKIGSEAYVGGDYQSDMIGFKDILSDSEILAVLSFIKGTWPAKVQRRHNRLNQRAR